jgi:hypothetical protein
MNSETKEIMMDVKRSITNLTNLKDASFFDVIANATYGVILGNTNFCLTPKQTERVNEVRTALNKLTKDEGETVLAIVTCVYEQMLKLFCSSTSDNVFIDAIESAINRKQFEKINYC